MEHEIQRIILSCSETVTERLLNLFNKTHSLWCTNQFTSQIESQMQLLPDSTLCCYCHDSTSTLQTTLLFNSPVHN